MRRFLDLLLHWVVRPIFGVFVGRFAYELAKLALGIDPAEWWAKLIMSAPSFAVVESLRWIVAGLVGLVGLGLYEHYRNRKLGIPRTSWLRRIKTWVKLAPRSPERQLVKRKPIDIWGPLKGLSPFDAHKLAEQWTGNWIEVVVTVKHNPVPIRAGSDIAGAIIRASDADSVPLHITFDQSWVSRVQQIREGDTIKVRGQIEDVHIANFCMNKAELLD